MEKVTRDISTKAFWLTCLLLFCLKLWLTRAYHVVATVTPHDDLLFIRHAHAILSGGWLGDYNQLTLIKEPFYPIFIALCNWLSLPLLASQQLLQALSCWVVIVAIRPVVEKKYLLLAAYAVLLCNPGSFSYPAVGRIFQLAIYPPLATMVLGCLIGMAIRSTEFFNFKKVLPWSIGLGVALSLFWITRDESIFIAPSIAVVLLFALVTAAMAGKKQFGRILLLCVLPFVFLQGTILVLQQINMMKYGVPDVIELTSDEFKSAYGGLLRIKSPEERQFFPVVRDARQKAYAVSPTFREVEKHLEGRIGEGWQSLSGNNDIPAAFFIWAFRDAVAAAGYHTSGTAALQFYRQMGAEIDAACDAGQLDCRKRFTSLVPTWHMEFNKLILPTMHAVLKKTVVFEGFNASAAPFSSTAPAEIIDLFGVVTGETILQGRFAPLPESARFLTHLNKEKTRILGQIGWVYQNIVPYLSVIAILVFLRNLWCGIRRKSLAPMTVFSISTLAGVLSITAVMTLLTITSYSEIGRVMTVSYPILLLFIISVFLDLAGMSRAIVAEPQDETASCR